MIRINIRECFVEFTTNQATGIEIVTTPTPHHSIVTIDFKLLNDPTTHVLVHPTNQLTHMKNANY